MVAMEKVITVAADFQRYRVLSIVNESEPRSCRSHLGPGEIVNMRTFSVEPSPLLIASA
jgi:hypothetical protein